MGFVWQQKVLFKHCDPAGIVFYPRYFEMINDCVEAFFANRLDWPFEKLHGAGAVPTVEIATTFTSPSRHGDILDFDLRVTRLGNTSMSLGVEAACDGAPRLTTKSTLVNVGAGGKPTPWPDAVRTRIQEIEEQQNGT